MAKNNHNQDAGDSGKRQESKAERSEREAEAHERGDIANSVESYNDNLKAQCKEQKISGRSKVTGKGQGADGKGGFSSAKDLLGGLAHETLTKDAEKERMSPQRKAQIMAELERDGCIVGKPQEQAAPKGSAEDTGKVTDYKPKQSSQAAFSLGMNYEDAKPESKDLFGKFGDFAEAAARNATNPLAGRSISDQAGFITAYKLDTAKLSSAKMEELQLAGRSVSDARDEVFADMYGHVSGARAGTQCFGDYSLKLKESFPNCLKYLEEI